MPQKSATILIVLAILPGSALIAGAIFLPKINFQNTGNSPTGSQLSSDNSSHYSAEILETFAKCLNEKGLVFYGAWWCSHCKSQKELFADAFKYVNYVECEKNPGVSQGELVDACLQANIEAYPTWILKDGTRKTGDLSLETLSELSSCQLQ